MKKARLIGYVPSPISGVSIPLYCDLETDQLYYHTLSKDMKTIIGFDKENTPLKEDIPVTLPKEMQRICSVGGPAIFIQSFGRYDSLEKSLFGVIVQEADQVVGTKEGWKILPPNLEVVGDYKGGSIVHGSLGAPLDDVDGGPPLRN